MQHYENADQTTLKRLPWNKGKLIGAKPPLRPKHVWSIWTKLEVGRWTRDFALFNLAIDSKLRGCDLVALKVEDVAPSGYAIDRATIRQKKTGQAVRFELTEQTRQAVDDYLRAATAWRIYVHRPTWVGEEHNDETIRAACLRVDRKHRPRPTSFRHPLSTTDQGIPHLPADW
jgi:integrase